MPKIIPTRTPMAEQPPAERVRNFDEVPFGYTPEEAMAEAERCLLCKRPTCIDGCPVHINIVGFLELTAKGDFRAAINLIKESDALPAITGRVCPQEAQCEKVCVMARKYEPVAIGRVERFLADWEASQGDLPVPELAPPSGKKVAVVGAGPAGLTVAADLARLGHQVTMFEALHEAGGVLVYGIPEFRLPKTIVQREVNYVCSLGVEPGQGLRRRHDRHPRRVARGVRRRLPGLGGRPALVPGHPRARTSAGCTRPTSTSPAPTS